MTYYTSNQFAFYSLNLVSYKVTDQFINQLIAEGYQIQTKSPTHMLLRKTLKKD